MPRTVHVYPSLDISNDEKSWVTIAEAARAARVTAKTVYRWVWAGLVDAHQLAPHRPIRVRLTQGLPAPGRGPNHRRTRPQRRAHGHSRGPSRGRKSTRSTRS